MRRADVKAEVIADALDGVVVALRWREPDVPNAFELFQVLRLRDGKIVDMQDFERRQAAMKAAVAAK